MAGFSVSFSDGPSSFGAQPDGNIVFGSELRVSCPFSDTCKSPSRKDPTKRKAWLCGSDFCHNDRKSGCIEYQRLHNGLKRGESAKDRRL
ncbi:MAG: hypothetical protein NWF01_07980 [Candidatus Bathyarchaeota archaeon]|nr:hypothetical protein [Candidatus Bathyarchaeota archaeon]